MFMFLQDRCSTSSSDQDEVTAWVTPQSLQRALVGFQGQSQHTQPAASTWQLSAHCITGIIQATKQELPARKMIIFFCMDRSSCLHAGNEFTAASQAS
jgi:hypothetical protein